MDKLSGKNKYFKISEYQKVIDMSLKVKISAFDRIKEAFEQ